jgi:hypothetical protein
MSGAENDCQVIPEIEVLKQVVFQKSVGKQKELF